MSEVEKKKPFGYDVCCYCSCKLDNFNRTKEHLDPKSKGGILSRKNKRFACHDCNSLKKHMTPEEFLEAIKMMYHETVRTFGRTTGRYKRMIENVKKIVEERNVAGKTGYTREVGQQPKSEE